MSIPIGQRDALLIVDVQRDFLPGGSLAVREGNEVVPVLNRYIGLAQRKGLPVIASRDWHPGKHCSFHDQGGIWPVHCVQDTPGAVFSSALTLPADTPVISKATREEADAYSAFDGTGLADRLHKGGIRRLLIGGLATDYCVLNTVLDALKSNFEVLLLEDAIRAVDVKPGDGERAKDEMRAAGAVAVNYEELS
ncbi:MAG: nicotinamidase [Betaproteobacteria bacterium]|nr:nicotinamidase [Betaproteobacteria bacterium]MDH3435553.1 nicotinamidase [Betaproteobacteria bacterium]